MISLGQEAQTSRKVTGIQLNLQVDLLKTELRASQSPAFLVRAKLNQAYDSLDEAFWQGADITACLNKRSDLVDQVLSLGWSWYGLDQIPVVLVAVGGYGRQVLHPQSDVDILVLASKTLSRAQNHHIEHFIAYTWDCGLCVGHSVRTLQECESISQQDFTVLSNLLDARYIEGDKPLFESLTNYTKIQSRKATPLKEFFFWKLKEREKRYHRFGHTEYTLEPNLKESPGGLRDIQLLGLFTKREFGTHDLEVLTTIGFITTEEKKALSAAQYVLWQIRYALHLVAGKSEDRLFLDYQENLARKFGFDDPQLNQAISSFMQIFFRSIRELREITSVLFQHFRELYQQDTITSTPLNNFASIQNQSICITDEPYLAQNPNQVLVLFEALAEHQNLRGFIARSTRFIINFYRTHPLIATTETKHLFLKLFKHPHGTSKALGLMARFGLLSQYCPPYRAIVGQMQYDLYHVYTVDAHILNMLETIQKFYRDPPDISFIQDCLHADLEPIGLYLGALFHDIGKGQGGNHSLIGYELSQQFCKDHQLEEDMVDLISWLVKEHLTLSRYARTKDLSQPEVIAQFCQIVQTKKRLDYLYVLTIADILATNPTLWNRWQETLLKNLYLAAKQFFNDQTELDPQHLMRVNQQRALLLLKNEAFDKDKITELWEPLGVEYFQVETPETIAWHTRELYQAGRQQPFIVALQPHTSQGGTEIFVLAPDRPHLFALCAATLDKLQLGIVQARIITSNDRNCMNTFVVLESSGLPITSPNRKIEIQQTLLSLLQPLIETPNIPPKIPFVSHRIRRQLRFFKHEAKVTLSNAESEKTTVLVVRAPDFPGLLARIGEAFMACDIFVHSAKINTLGKRVEDVFHICDRQTNLPITDKNQLLHLKSVILGKLKAYWNN